MSAERLRLFIAVELAAEVRAALSATLRELADCGADARWTPPENLHLTLKFLGAVAPDRVDAIGAALGAAVAPVPAGVIETRGLGVFPHPRQPRIVWAGIAGELPAQLAARVESAGERLGFRREKRAFHPHVTVARLRGRRGWASLRERLDALATRSFGLSEVKGVFLFRSDLRRDGAVYTKLSRAPLASPVDEGGGTDGS